MCRPILLSTWSFGVQANQAGWPYLAGPEGSPLDAVEAACRCVESDAGCRTVGRGGYPDRSGQITLDAAVMLSPGVCGSVAYVKQFEHPVTIARRVMQKTPHVLLVGDGAERFAMLHGMAPADLSTEPSREAWRRWIEEHPEAADDDQRGYLPPANFEQLGLGAEAARARPSAEAPPGPLLPKADLPRACPPEELLPHNRTHDTVGVLARSAAGILAGACSTSGIAYKVPGRVGDSPIIGQGLYVDPLGGAAVATGTGELVMGICGSFLAVESMRQGASAAEAAERVIRRVDATYDLRPEHQVGLIALAKDGTWASAALRAGFSVAVRTPERDALVPAGWVRYP